MNKTCGRYFNTFLDGMSAIKSLRKEKEKKINYKNNEHSRTYHKNYTYLQEISIRLQNQDLVFFFYKSTKTPIV